MVYRGAIVMWLYKKCRQGTSIWFGVCTTGKRCNSQKSSSDDWLGSIWIGPRFFSYLAMHLVNMLSTTALTVKCSCQAIALTFAMRSLSQMQEKCPALFVVTPSVQPSAFLLRPRLRTDFSAVSGSCSSCMGCCTDSVSASLCSLMAEVSSRLFCGSVFCSVEGFLPKISLKPKIRNYHPIHD